MKYKGLILFSLFVGILLVGGCEVPEQTTTEEKSVIKKPEIQKEGGILTERLSFEDESISGEVIKNKLTKTAEIKMTMDIPDEIEHMDLFGEEVSGVPFTVNFACGLFAVGFFSPERLEEWQESGNVTSEGEAELTNLLEGYTVTKARIDFVDKEDRKLIAKCTATGSEWEDIKFNAYREYETSLFGMVIGKTTEEVEEEATKKALSKEVTHLEVACLQTENWDADADDDGILLGVAPLSADNTPIAVEGSITTKAYVLERDEDTWDYYKGNLVNIRNIPDIEGEERFDYFSSWYGYLIKLIWDNTEPYPADKRDYGIVYATFTTKDGKTFEGKIGDDFEDCQIRPK